MLFNYLDFYCIVTKIPLSWNNCVILPKILIFVYFSQGVQSFGVSGYTLNTQTLMKTDEQKEKRF